MACTWSACVWFGAGCVSPPVATQRASLASSSAGPLLVVGDTQLTSWAERYLLLREENEFEQGHLVSQMVRDAERLHPAFAVHLGDLVTRGSSAAAWQHYDELMAPLLARGIRIRPVLGNHDYWGPDEQGVSAARRRYPELSPNTYYSDVHRGLGLIWLNTELSNGSDEPRSDWQRQKAWFVRKLAELEKDPDIWGVLLFAHRPPYTRALMRSGDEGVKDDILPSFFESKKTLAVLSGHVHGYEHRVVRGKHFIITGGGGGPRVQYRGLSPYQRLRSSHPRGVRFWRVGRRHVAPLNYLLLDIHDQQGEEKIRVTVRCLEATPGCRTGILTEDFELAPPG